MTEDVLISDLAERLALLARIRRNLSWDEAAALAAELLVPWEQNGPALPREEIPDLVAALNRLLDERDPG
jgi:hypothetical protein